MSYKENWKVPKLDIKKGQWYVCTQSWSDDGWTKFFKGEVVQAVEDGCFIDCYKIKHYFNVDGICYFRPADKDEIPEKYRLKDIELTEFEQALYDKGIEGESFVSSHNDTECKHEVRRIAGELLPMARKMLEPKIRHEVRSEIFGKLPQMLEPKIRHDVRSEIFGKLPHWQKEPDGAGGGERECYLIRTSKGHYFTSKSIGGTNYYLLLDDLEVLPGLPKEDMP